MPRSSSRAWGGEDPRPADAPVFRQAGGLEPSPRYRYGLFLRPPARISRVQAEVHGLLRAQYGLSAAGAFPPHMTILGHVPSTQAHGAIINAAQAAIVGVRPVALFNRGVREQSGGIIHDVGRLASGEPNPALLELFRLASAHFEQLRTPTADFRPGVTEEEHFYGHMTLAGHDLQLRPELLTEVLTFLSQLGSDIDQRGDFVADTVALYEFETRSGWDGRWWETMTWRLLKSFTLS